MKADYNELLLIYEANESDILGIIAGDMFEAMEAGNTPDVINGQTATKDTVSSDETKSYKKLGLMEKVTETVKKLIKKIGEMLNQLKLKMKNRIRMLFESDKGFQRDYYKQKSIVKPNQNVRVITYQYKNSELDGPVDKMMRELNKCFDVIAMQGAKKSGDARISQILNAPQNKMISVLLEPYTHDDSIDSINGFIKYLVDKFRGQKKELTFNISQVSNIEAIALSVNKLVERCNGYVKGAETAYNRVKTIEFHIKRSTNNEEVLRAASNNIARASVLYNAYSALVQGYYELKLEQCLNYRVILKKFYQF